MTLGVGVRFFVCLVTNLRFFLCVKWFNYSVRLFYFFPVVAFIFILFLAAVFQQIG